MHRLLRHLEDVGSDVAPRLLGIDAKGREILSFQHGDVFTAFRPRDWSAALITAAHGCCAGCTTRPPACRSRVARRRCATTTSPTRRPPAPAHVTSPTPPGCGCSAPTSSAPSTISRPSCVPFSTSTGSRTRTAGASAGASSPGSRPSATCTTAPDASPGVSAAQADDSGHAVCRPASASQPGQRGAGGSRTSAVAITSSSPAPGDGRPALAQRGVGGGEFPGPLRHRHAGRGTQVRRLASVTEPRRGRTGPLGRRRAASRRSSGPVRSRPTARPGPGRRRARPRSAPAPTGKGTGRPHFRCLAWRGRGRVPRVKAQARPRHWRTAQTVIVVCRAAGLMIAMRRPATG